MEIKKAFLCLAFITVNIALNAQSPYQAPPEKEITQSTGVWLGLYTKYHFNDKWAYYGEYHLRRRDGLSEMAQIYLRFGATYKIATNLDFTAGFVNPWYWAPNPEGPNIDKVVPQYRLWQQAVLATPFDHIGVFHQLRTEQRYRRHYEQGSPWKLTYRFRYKLTIYVPLNRRDLGPKAVFLSLYDEIFIQAGKSIVYNHFEDNRAFIGIGYNPTRKLQIQMGYMNTFRHNGAPHLYESRHILRVSLYHHLDFHLDRQPKVREIPIH